MGVRKPAKVSSTTAVNEAKKSSNAEWVSCDQKNKVTANKKPTVKQHKKVLSFEEFKKRQRLPDPQETAREKKTPECVNVETQEVKKSQHHAKIENLDTKLEMPQHHKDLLSTFSDVDFVASVFHNKPQTVTFSKLKNGVSRYGKKTLNEETLGKIKSLYPTAYSFSQQKSLQKTHSKYELVISPNLTAETDPEVGNKSACNQQIPETGQPRFTTGKLHDRKQHFHRCLLQNVYEHHQRFCQALLSPVKAKPSQINRWHPSFDVTSVPEVTPASLPQPPTAAGLTMNAQSVLRMVNKDSSFQIRLQSLKKSEANVKADSDKKAHSSPGKQTSATTPSAQVPAVKSASMSLLERIRKKEAEANLEKMARTHQIKKQTEILERLPQIARILWDIFIRERRPALKLDIITQKVVDSYPHYISASQADAHFKLLTEMEPKFISYCKVQSGMYLKVDAKQDINAIRSRLTARYEESK